MIGKHVVIDTLDNFKTKLSLIPSSAIVLIKDVGQIYAHGTYFGAQKTYPLLTKTADGLAPKGGTSASSLISDVNTEWVLTVTNGENPTWRKLPANAFSSSSYTLPSATASDLGGIKVGQVYTTTFDDLVGLYYKVNIDKNGLAYVHVPWINNPYTASGSGIALKDNVFSLSLNSVTKLDSAIGNKIYAVSLDKNGKLCVSVPWTDTNNIFVGATETINGSSGMVPAPIANQHSCFLRGDGTWVKPNLSDLNDDVVNGKYLPLSGGTLNGDSITPLTIDSITSTQSRLAFSLSGVNKAIVGYHTTYGAWLYNVPSNTFIGIKDDKTAYYYDNGYKTLLHEGNYSSYALPINGGLMGGAIQWGSKSLPVSISTSSGYLSLDSKGSEICIAGGNNTSLYVNYRKSAYGYAPGEWHIFTGDASTYAAMYVGDIYSKGKLVIHVGNIGEQSVSAAKQLNYYSKSTTFDANTLYYTDEAVRYISQISNKSSNFPTHESWQNAILAIPLHSNGVTAQLYFSYNKSLYYRSNYDLDWNEIAYTTSNVASATKLQTARTIWGQSFDGTKQIVGSLISDTTKSNYEVNYSIYRSGARFTASDLSEGECIDVTVGKSYAAKQIAYLGYWQGANDSTTFLRLGFHSVDNIIIANALGNVGIGTTSPSYKLDVSGNSRIAGNLLVGSNNTYNYIAFYGTTGDNPGSYNHTYIGENIWASNESSELVLFKGNDAATTATTAADSGPDRIRHIAGGHLFQIYKSVLYGEFSTICTSTVPVNILSLNLESIVSYVTLRPDTNDKLSLGTSSYKWKNVYATTFTGNLSGNADTVDGYHLSVTSSAGTDTSTIYFVT